MRDYRGLSNTDRTKAANNILGAFLSDQEVPESSIEHVYTMLTTYEISTPRWQRLFNAILNEVEKLLLSPAAGVIKTMEKTLFPRRIHAPGRPVHNVDRGRVD